MSSEDTLQLATVSYRPIGVVHSPIAARGQAPGRPAPEDGIAGTVELRPELADGLQDLEGFSHVVILSHLDRVSDVRLRLVPRRDTRERGLFATRAPCRPNPIGLSTVRLERIEGTVLHVRGLDLLDRTPVLDLKPWVGELPEAAAVRRGWLDQIADD